MRCANSLYQFQHQNRPTSPPTRPSDFDAENIENVCINLICTVFVKGYMRCNRDITFDWIELETYSAITPAQARPNHASLQQLGRDRTSGWSLIFSSPSCSGRHQALHRQVEVSSGESQGVLCANSINLSCFLDFLRLGAGSFRQPTYLPRFVGKLLKIHRKFLTDSVKSLQNISKYVKGKSCLLQIVPPQLPTPRNTLIRFDFQRFFGIWPGFPTIPANIPDLFTEK